VLIKRLLDGDWDDDFLVLQPGERIAMSYDDKVIKQSEQEEIATLHRPL